MEVRIGGGVGVASIEQLDEGERREKGRGKREGEGKEGWRRREE